MAGYLKSQMSHKVRKCKFVENGVEIW